MSCQDKNCRCSDRSTSCQKKSRKCELCLRVVESSVFGNPTNDSNKIAADKLVLHAKKLGFMQDLDLVVRKKGQQLKISGNFMLREDNNKKWYPFQKVRF